MSLIPDHVLTPLRREFEREFEPTAAVLYPPVEPTERLLRFSVFDLRKNKQIRHVMMQK